MKRRRTPATGLGAVVFLVIVVAVWIARGGLSPSPTVTPVPGSDSGAITGRQAARVVRVVDGDTIIVDLAGREERLRYIGIDAPESVTPNQPVEPYGREAAAANRELVDGKTVWLERDVSDLDTNGRLLRYVYVGSTLVNGELVRRGLAEAKTYRPDVKRQGQLDSLEREARDARRGMWSAD